MYIPPDSFGRQMAGRRFARTKQKIRQVVRNDAVDLLGHATIETPQSRFNMGYACRLF